MKGYEHEALVTDAGTLAEKKGQGRRERDTQADIHQAVGPRHETSQEEVGAIMTGVFRKSIWIGMLLLLPAQTAWAAEIDGCNSDRVKSIIMRNTFLKLKDAAGKVWLSSASGRSDPKRVETVLNQWVASINSVRQRSYDAVNNARYCIADFEYQNMPPMDMLVALVLMQDPACEKSVSYKVEPILDKPNDIYVSWQCLR